MPKLITDTAPIQCDKGSTPTLLKVTSQQFDKIEDKLQATEDDKQPNANILPFGVCKITQKSCVPAPIQWQKTSVFTVDDKKELTDESICPCSIGGKITFIQPGQSGFVKIE